MDRELPSRFEADPHPYRLPEATRLWRVHHTKNKATDFTMRPTVRDSGVGGRFDGTADNPYPTFYAALDARTALAETFLRNVPYNDSGVRTIRRKQVANRRISVVETTTDLSLVNLLEETALAAVAADSWLIHAESADYADTRRWASWIRRQAPWAQGLIWPSKRQAGRESVMLFGDRCPSDVLWDSASSRIDLDDEVGAVWINAVLAPCRARIMPPPRRRTRPH